MARKYASRKTLDFLLYDVYDIESLTKYPYFEDHGKEIFDLVLDTAFKMGDDLLLPCFEEMDKEPPEYVDGACKVHPKVRDYLAECGEGGWIGATMDYEIGGQQMPSMLGTAMHFVLCAANYSMSVYSTLIEGAAHLIESFGTEELKETYIPNMLSGLWQGTMALTEPQAGSSLSDVNTLAEPTDGGYYLLKGQKIFISAGDHDQVENVVHLMLGRIKGAPAGVKGLSLFVVPKLRPEEDGSLTPNDVNLAGIYHKLGYRGAPITQLSMGEAGDCRAWLVGDANKGLAYMFQMMNSARLDVGLAAAAIASAAYHASLEYTKERPQGRKLNEKDPTKPQVPIIEHADVRRMLLFQRAIVEGSLALITYGARLQDEAKGADEEAKADNLLLLDLLTPIAKSYPSEMGILSVSQGLQCLGGYGFCDEFPLEQLYRDCRIHPIHEGTTGIQGQDILGRKVMIKNGRAFTLYMEKVTQTIEKAKAVQSLAGMAGKLEAALENLQNVTNSLMALAAKGNAELFLADATLYLEFFGIVAIAWQWLTMALAAQAKLDETTSEAMKRFYQGKLVTCRYFFGYELPKTLGLAERLTNPDGLTVDLDSAILDD